LFALAARRAEKENLQLARIGIKFANHPEFETATFEAAKIMIDFIGPSQYPLIMIHILSSGQFENQARLSDMASDVSWELMLYRSQPSEARWNAIQGKASHLCGKLSAAENVLTEPMNSSVSPKTLDPSVKRRLLEERRSLEPMLTKLTKFLPKIQLVLAARTLSDQDSRFLQSEFASLGIILQDREL
jgi:hypothetical protein